MLKKKQVVATVSIALVCFLIGTSVASDGGNPWNRVWEAIYGLQAKVDSLNASLAELEAKVNNLVPYAIPHNATYSHGTVLTSSTSFEDIPDMSVDITLTKDSTLLITFGAESEVNPSGGNSCLRALVNSTQTNPTDTVVKYGGGPESRSQTFYSSNLSAGTYTVKMQWKVAIGTGNLTRRTLIVIALPTENEPLPQ